MSVMLEGLVSLLVHFVCELDHQVVTTKTTWNLSWIYVSHYFSSLM